MGITPESDGDPGLGHLVRPPVRSPKRHSRQRTLATRSLLPAAVLGLWCLLTYGSVISAQLLPSPSVVVSTLGNLWDHQQLAYQLQVSLGRSLLGFAIGGGAGLVLGVASGLTLIGEELVDAPMQMLRMVPFLALVPLFILWMGIDETPKVALIALATVYPVYLNASTGVRHVDKKVVEAARIFGLSRVRLSKEVILPMALPQILTGIRFSLGISILALVAAEQINAKAGIGYIMLNAQNYNELNVIFVCVLLYVVFGIMADLLVRLVEHLAMPWRAGVSVR
ncbi:MAG: ABC transporter permease [Acidobacteriota bacterium]|nr:ABC transporter permease [Acidobacteriota bacterium]